MNYPSAARYLEAWLAVSLAEPLIVERTGGNDLLVEFRVREDRIGYLICTVLADVVAVRTFKFLTMEGTPEGADAEEAIAANAGTMWIGWGCMNSWRLRRQI